MAYDRFLIAPYQNGLRKDLATWLVPEDSFQTFKNVNVFRGKIKKRFGSELTSDQLHSRARILLSRLAVAGGAGIGITDGAGVANGTLPAGYIYTLGQRFSIGAETLTVTALGIPAALTGDGAGTGTLNTVTGAFVFAGTPAVTQVYWHCEGNAGSIQTDGAGAATGIAPGRVYKVGQSFSIGAGVFTVAETGVPAAMLSTGAGAATGTFNTTTGAFTILGAAFTTAIYFYPSEPIMAITHYEKGPINEHVTYAIDTEFVYIYSGTEWIKDPAFTGILQGGNTNFFWSGNYLGVDADSIALFITNFNATTGVPADADDPMYYYNGVTWVGFSAYTKFNSAEDFVYTAKIIIPWKNRLLLLNTVENDISGPTNIVHPNRIRWSHNGSPFPSGVAGVQGHPWLQRRQTYVDGATTYRGDGAGYLDAPVEEQIMSASVIKDRLIVYFERSTWELAYTGNPGLPFVWKSISQYVGCESTFSSINLESDVVTVDTTGIYACNGTSLNRIDNQIPNEVFKFLKSAAGTKRVHGIKDFYNGLLYWTFLDYSASTVQTYPDQVLVYNYESQAWSLYDDTITTFGYFEQSTDRDWSVAGTWATLDSWGSYYSQGKSRRILAGNHKGYLFLLNNDLPTNADAYPIARMEIVAGVATRVTIPNHNLTDGEYVRFKDANVTSVRGGVAVHDAIMQVVAIDADRFYLADRTITGVYAGGGTLAKVSKIDMKSKDWNPYVKTGDKINLAKIDFCVINTQSGKISVDYTVDAANGVNFKDAAINNDTALGTNVLEMHGNIDLNPLEEFKKILWKTVYFQAFGDFVSINLTHTNAQMIDPTVSLLPFELQGMILYTSKGQR